MPIKLKIENTSHIDLKEVEVFNCLNKIMAGRRHYEFGIEISVVYPQYISYSELVWSIATGTELYFAGVVLTYPEDTFNASLLLKLSDLFGTHVQAPFFTEVNPELDNRANKKVLHIIQKMAIDKRTSLLIKELKANSYIIIDFLSEEDMIKKREWVTPNSKIPDRGSKIIIMVEDQMMTGVVNDNDSVKVQRYNNSTKEVDIPWSSVEVWSVCEEEPI